MRLLGVISIAAIPLFVLVSGDDNNAEACGAKVSIKGAKLARMRKISSSNRTPIAAGPMGVAARGAVNVGGDSTQRGAVGHGGGEAGKVPGAKRRKASKPIAQKEPTPEPPKETQPAATPDLPRKPDKTEEPAPKEETPPPAEPEQPDKVKGKFASHYFFGNASAQLSAANQGKLKQMARWLKNNPGKSITVEGHASTNGNLDANRTLSESRANKVKEYLVELGADESRISVEAFGSDRPEFKPGSSAKNRRVIIVVK